MQSRRFAILFALILASLLALAAVDAQDAPPVYGLSADQILAYQPPQFESPTVDNSLLHDRNYQQVSGDINTYDAPNGSVVRTLDAGFNFVTALSSQDGWTEINPGEWVPSSALTDVNSIISHFRGVFLPTQPRQYPIAWMVINAYASDTPGGPSLESNRLLYRYTLVNLFSTVKVDGVNGDAWDWYQIGPDEWVRQTSVARVMPIERPAEVDTERWVAVDLYEQTLTAYEGDTPVFATLISSGMARFPTNEGLFHIYYRHVREDMTWGTPGDDFYYLEDIPWTMFFDDGRALHGTYWHDGFGFARSHGCVNMSITDAHWLYTWVAEQFDGKLNSPDRENGPAVYVYRSDGSG